MTKVIEKKQVGLRSGLIRVVLWERRRGGGSVRCDLVIPPDSTGYSSRTYIGQVKDLKVGTRLSE